MADLYDAEVLARDFQSLLEEKGHMNIALTPYDAFCIIGQLQLALRHPSNVGAPADTGRRLADTLAEMLPESAQPVIEAGWIPGKDG